VVGCGRAAARVCTRLCRAAARPHARGRGAQGFLGTQLGLGSVSGFDFGSLLLAVGGALLLLWGHRRLRGGSGAS
jgi:hypothetical protein